MRAIVLHGPHDLRIEERPAPPPPGPGDVTVRLRAGGICGSDLHYFHDGGFGTVRVREPIILGHEVAGEIEALGEGVSGLAVGQRVAVNPSRPCRQCAHCRAGRAQLCREVVFNGSAMRFPHVQGLFREVVTVPAAAAVPVSCDLAQAAMIEPFAVALHAVNRAPSLLGARVLVSGAGPIGCLVAAACRLAGAAEIVATDIAEPPLAIARRLGADRTVNVADGASSGGDFDAAFDCSGAGPAILGAIDALRPGGALVAVGLGAEPKLPTNLIVTREIALLGTFRFDAEFGVAAQLLSSGRVDLSSLVTHALPLAQAGEAFAIASDKAKAMKVQIALDA